MAEQPKTIASVAEFLKAVLEEEKQERVLAYRGHSKFSYKLEPRVFRADSAKKAEEEILSELLTESPDDFREDRSVFEQLVRAQHYGLPTRLLDVTLNPLVALFFASREGDYFSEDGEVVIFRVSKQRAKLFDSDTISVISNTAKLSYEEKNTLYKFMREARGKGGVSSIDVDESNDREEIKRIVQFIRVEKPYFKPQVKPLDLVNFFFARPKRNNKRIIAQGGAFILSSLNKVVTSGGSTAFEVDRIRVSSLAKDEILRDLDRLHINARTMFPEIENVSSYIASKYK